MTDSGRRGTDWLDVREFGASGSEFETQASTEAGSNTIRVEDPGDFKPGQGVILTRCNVHVEGLRAIPADQKYSRGKPVEKELELRGFDGSSNGWVIFLIEVESGEAFRWSDDRGKTWQKHIPVTGDWQPLSAGVEVRIGTPLALVDHLVTFDVRDRLVTTIASIEGNTVTLADAPNGTAGDAVLRHEDTAALQAAIDRAIADRRNVYFPVGRYRMVRGLKIENAEGLTLEGANGQHTFLDMSESVGECFHPVYGKEVTIRNFRILGSSGLDEAFPRHLHLSSGKSFWRMTFKHSRAVHIIGTESVLVENVHVRRVSCECFYCRAEYREGRNEPDRYTKRITYLRCSVTDCGFNAFNNNDLSESTDILYNRVENIGNCTWEGPGRFVRIVGNYVRNGGVCVATNMYHRFEHLHDLGGGQTIIADNVFEGQNPNRNGINVSSGGAQIVIKNNLFVNYASNAISVQGGGRRPKAYPASNVVVDGNIIDLTDSGPEQIRRTGITIGASDTIVSNNQVYVRGERDPRVGGIRVREGALNVNVHDNLVRNCWDGMTAHRLQSLVGEVIDGQTFRQEGGVVPHEWRTSHLYRGWTLAWLRRNPAKREVRIEAFDAGECTFRLAELCDMKPGDSFEVYPPSANWNLHENTVTDCERPVWLDAYGSDTSLFRNNIISRGDAESAQTGMLVSGRMVTAGNHVVGFDETAGAAGSAPDPAVPAWRVPRVTGGITVDGDVGEWPWDDPGRVICLDKAPDGTPRPACVATACAARDDDALFVAVRVTLGQDAPRRATAPDCGKIDGVSLVLRSGNAEERWLPFRLWGQFDGICRIWPHGDIEGDLSRRLEQGLTYGSRVGRGVWTCEWRLPFAEMGFGPDTTDVLQCNLGVYRTIDDGWTLWVPTREWIEFGFMPTHVDFAGEMRLEE